MCEVRWPAAALVRTVSLVSVLVHRWFRAHPLYIKNAISSDLGKLQAGPCQ